MAKDVIMPVLGMNQETGTLVEWLKAEGDTVTKGEPLMLVGTDKTDVELEAGASGVLANVSAQPGDEVPVGSTIAIILAPGETAPAKVSTAQPPTVAALSAPVPAIRPISPVAARLAAEHNVEPAAIPAKGNRIQKEDVLAYIAAQQQVLPQLNGRVLASPKARRIAQEQGLDIGDITGSGPDGAILTADVLATNNQQPTPNNQSLSRAWKVMAQRLQESWQTVPHFYLERNVDVTALMAWRKQAQARMKQKLTVTDLLTKVVAAALSQHPRINASWIDEQIVLNHDINVGLAVAIEDGLLVPVIHHADQLGLGSIAERRAAVVTKALAGSLALDDMQAGTFTISNLGMFGITKFNAIVNPPQAAILAVGAVEERIVPVKGKPKVRPMMTLTLSCDHRVVDGARGAKFMETLVACLMEPLGLLD